MRSLFRYPPHRRVQTTLRAAQWLSACGAIASVSLVTHSALAVPRIVSVEVRRNVSDFSSRGLNIGSAGYWFANFANENASRLATPDDHDANQLPSWMLVDFDPTSDADPPPYSFSLTPGPAGPDATSTGGVEGYNKLTLPDGSAGLSGQLVDTDVGQGGNNTLIKAWEFGPGAPTSLLLHVVLDNAPLAAGTAVDRLRITHTNAEGGIKDRASFDELSSRHDGIADVYTFRLEGVEVGGSFALQLAALADGSNQDTGLAGIAFDALEFPSAVSAFDRRWLLALLGVLLLMAGWFAGRYSKRRPATCVEHA